MNWKLVFTNTRSFLSLILIDGLIHLSNIERITFPFVFIMFDNITLATFPKVDDKLYSKQRKTKAVSYLIPEVLVRAFILNVLINADFFVFKVAPLT